MIKVHLLLFSLLVTGFPFIDGLTPRVGLADTAFAAEAPKATFIEIGSVMCIPCKQMQPVMKAVEKRYGSQLTVLFYDIGKPDQRQIAEKYLVRMIPTQVFLDRTGREFFRHEGFLSEEQIDRLLKQRGLIPIVVKAR